MCLCGPPRGCLLGLLLRLRAGVWDALSIRALGKAVRHGRGVETHSQPSEALLIAFHL